MRSRFNSPTTGSADDTEQSGVPCVSDNVESIELCAFGDKVSGDSFVDL